MLETLAQTYPVTKGEQVLRRIPKRDPGGLDRGYQTLTRENERTDLLETASR